jgi:mannose-6-phosphate isomerase-like protein (cupin superfamily)
MMNREILLNGEGGEAIWFLEYLMVIKATTDATGGWAFIDQLLPAGSGPPQHVHRDEDEAFYVVEGKGTFYLDDKPFEAGPGSFMLLPRGVKHTFQIDAGAPARILIVTSPLGNFEKFVREMGRPAQSLTLPPVEGPPDIEKLTVTAALYNIDIVGPPVAGQ